MAHPRTAPPIAPDQTVIPQLAIPQLGSTRWGRIPAWWLDHPDLDADGFAVLAALATYADDEGTCWPSQSTLAGKLKRSRPTINRILQRLQDLGLVEITHRRGSNGARLSCLYRVRFSPAGPSTTSNDRAEASVGNRAGEGDDSSLNAPCPASSQEQPYPEQNPDSLRGPARVEAQEVPDEWMPDAADLAWASSRYGRIDLSCHVEGFVLRCRAHGYRYRDIGAAWRSWLVQDVAAGKAPAAAGFGITHASGMGPNRSRETIGEQRLGAWAAVAARLTQDALSSNRS